MHSLMIKAKFSNLADIFFISLPISTYLDSYIEDIMHKKEIPFFLNIYVCSIAIFEIKMKDIKQETYQDPMLIKLQKIKGIRDPLV